MIRAFLLDRLAVIILFMLNTALATVVFHLFFSTKESSVERGVVAYAFLLCLFLLVTWLIVEYVRSRRYLKKLYEYTKGEGQDGLFENMHMPTYEARLWQEGQWQQRRKYEEKLDMYIRAHEQQQLFFNQWVHHMKTPVSVISLLVQQGKNDGNDTVLDEISDENDRFRHGLELLLHLARLDHFAMDLKAEKVDIITVISSIVNEEKRQFIRRGVFPEIQGERGVYFVYSDEKWLRVLLQQIVFNALKYSPQQAGAKMTFKLREGKSQILLDVIDQGVGIAKHDVPRVFEPFFTGENGRKFQESTGMGLYLAKTIAKGLGHSLTLTSEKGVGTTVTIAFSSKTLHNMTTL
ncbi:sensor histidine kinase [Shouchella lonarensis]|uniref:histidine kinase n=1 Tax=Shouchella lonarensis TaxID=1464122 RepID=A0A1G6NE36_9BACI|nr:sensor histidine kinase [Shouchella lonarensis]SDC65616.1 two-component system, OmpR family, sensor kinase [Shouchella lonarensis]